MLSLSLFLMILLRLLCWNFMRQSKTRSKKVDSFNFPTYFASAKEVEKIVKRNWSFSVEIVERHWPRKTRLENFRPFKSYYSRISEELLRRWCLCWGLLWFVGVFVVAINSETSLTFLSSKLSLFLYTFTTTRVKTSDKQRMLLLNSKLISNMCVVIFDN